MNQSPYAVEKGYPEVSCETIQGEAADLRLPYLNVKKTETVAMAELVKSLMHTILVPCSVLCCGGT